MSYLILDTDKNTTHALRLQLSIISQNRVWDVINPAMFTDFQKKHKVPPEVILLDLDGDPLRVKAFLETLFHKSASSALVTLGSVPFRDPMLKTNYHLQKPIFPQELKTALVKAESRAQEIRSGIIYLGTRVPAELLREVGRSGKLWKHVQEVQSLEYFIKNRTELTQVGAIFVQPEKINEAEIAALQQINKVTSAAKISLVCLSNSHEDIRPLRTLCDYFLPLQTDWRQLLDELAETRLMRLNSQLGIDEAKLAMQGGSFERAQKTLKEVIKKAPMKTEAIMLSGECSFQLKKKIPAENCFYSALNLNPCLPKAYARLLQLKAGNARQRVLDDIEKYCPGLKDIGNVESDRG